MTEQEFLRDFLHKRINMFNTDEQFLYQQGIIDGIRIMNFIDTL